MKPEKPSLFIGSTQECRDAGIVKQFIEALGGDANCVPWWSVPQFNSKGSATTFAGLCAAASAFDFAVFILTGDDQVICRGNTSAAPRDNVVFEMGLFIGALGPERVMAYVPGETNIKVPSDLSGVTIPRFEFDVRDEFKSIASVEKSCSGFSKNITKHSFRAIDLYLAARWWFDRDKREFAVDLSSAKITRDRSTIGPYSLCIAARVRDPNIEFEYDAKVVYSNIRRIGQEVNENVEFRIPATTFKTPITSGSRIQGRVLLIPESLDFENTSTLEVAVKARCRSIESFSLEIGE